jgi:hypothetical protein
MLIDDLLALFNDLPMTLAVGWAGWLFAGLLLSMWQRRENKRLVLHVATQRQKSGVRPPSGVRAVPRPVKSVPTSSGDAFGELEALLDAPAGNHRLPGDTSPVMTEPSRSPSPALAAPQSLP